jgi:predicted nuclease of restriction endonuclease-like (RecB) superfamily
MTEIMKLSEYRVWLRDLKQQIKTGQIKAALSVNSQMIMLYWDLGGQIVEKQEKAQWGSGFIEQLSKDLREEFPEMTGFSADNLKYMRIFYKFYSQISEQPVRQFETQVMKQLVSQFPETLNISKVAQVVPELKKSINQDIIISEQLVRQFACVPWGHHMLILKIKDLNQALFYINKTIENNWSRAVLEYQIESNLYGRQGKAITNFNLTLPAPQSDLANQMMKSPYDFGFLRLPENVKEIELEKALVQHISHFLPELGIGFAYMGRQFSLKVGGEDYRTDLLFYQTRLKCYVIIELKTRKFEPEFVGKLNFYITTINELVKDDRDAPTIGMLLCKNKNNYAVEFSLKDVNNPIGVSAFHYTELADEMKAALPSVEELQNELLNFEREHGRN